MYLYIHKCVLLRTSVAEIHALLSEINGLFVLSRQIKFESILTLDEGIACTNPTFTPCEWLIGFSRECCVRAYMHCVAKVLIS